MELLLFLRTNARWLVGGFALFFFSAFGQTYFISLSAGDIRAEYELSHGQFGSLYMAATLLSALTLPMLGQIVDRYRPRNIVLFIVPMLAIASAAMAFSRHVALLFVTIYLLRLFGQGMMTHTAFTLIGRWFSAKRGQAMSLSTLGLNTGEALLPLMFVVLSPAIGWHNIWWLGAGVLIVIALPLISILVSVERLPQQIHTSTQIRAVRDWTRSEVLRDPLFYLVLAATMPPAFIGTTIFFNQVYLVELRGWAPEIFASSFTLYAVATIIFALISGQIIDRVSGIAMLPFYLLPMGLGCVLLGTFSSPSIAFVFMLLYGVSNGFSLTLFGALWPELYGLKHLGAIRAVIVSVLVFASAMGPGLSGFLIDAQVNYPAQIIAMGLYCVLISAIMVQVSRKLRQRAISA